MKEFLRDAEEFDMDLLFQWVNDKEVRKSSFQTKDITYEEHQKWFMDMLHREDARQYIYVLDEEPVGQIRIRLAGEEAEISYSIAPKYRCMGYGKRMISALKRAVQGEYPDIKRLVAQVKPENVASQKVFLDCGYYEKSREFVLDLEMVKG
ncbi:MAG: GNAT family N-acetyltransferase [Roseburia sp.]|nr:GNAT family N-acetyltransferase [Roseburia sp.]